MSQSLLGIFAHPDDETFAIAGALRQSRAAGRVITLVVATDGEAGRSSGIPVSGPEELAVVRRAELIRAAGILGVDRVHPLGLPDGQLSTWPPDPLLATLVGAVRDARPQVIVTFGPEGAPNRHPDHRVISRLATAAYFLASNLTMYPDAGTRREPWHPERLYYCSWEGDHPAGPDRPAVSGCPITCSLDVRGQLEAKQQAFEEYASQHEHRKSFEYTVLPMEHYSLAAGRPQPEPVTSDLFAGL